MDDLETVVPPRVVLPALRGTQGSPESKTADAAHSIDADAHDVIPFPLTGAHLRWRIVLSKLMAFANVLEIVLCLRLLVWRSAAHPGGEGLDCGILLHLSRFIDAICDGQVTVRSPSARLACCRELVGWAASLSACEPVILCDDHAIRSCFPRSRR
jgi:hypothetical protein